MATLLFVDDEELIGMVVSRFFAMRGHVAHLARSVGEAKTILLEGTDPSIIFLDVWLGNESGADVLSWIQEHRPHLADRVVFVTGEHPASNPSPPWMRFNRPVIRKPFDLNTLVAELEAAESRAGT